MIRFTIQRKVFLATFSLATIMVLLLALVMRWNLGQGFERYTSAAEFARLDWMITNIETEYAAHGNWDFIRAEPERAWRRLLRPNQDSALLSLAEERKPVNVEDATPGSPPDAQPDPEGRPPQRAGDGVPRRPPWARDRPPRPPWDNGPPRQTTGALPAAETLPSVEAGKAPPQQLRPADRLPPGNDALRVAPRLTLLDTDGKRLAGNTGGSGTRTERPILYKGAPVGRLALEAAPSSARDLDAAFLASQTQNMIIAGLTALGLSLLAAWALARQLLAPIRDLTTGARKIADGWLDARIPVRRDDELGELADDFNHMAERLSCLEESRRAWISDTSHELRTPLAVLRAEIEAMQDGVRMPDTATLARLHKQVQQLAKLVDDLRLTLDREPGIADMEHVPLSPLAVLEETITAFRERYESAGIVLDTTSLADAGWRIRGDAGRLTQVFTNLLENTLRYTHKGGRLRITAHADEQRLALHFDDSAPAPPPAALPHLFERFFRAEPSRSRALGGSGLGLAICKTLIEAHGGCITASFSELGGLAIRIDFPLEKP
jgi:two-component system sensor histidine kinase BaeS